MKAHTRARQIELARSLPPTAIYLDTKFWLIARDVVRKVRIAPAEIMLVRRIGELVTQRKVFCPISETLFIELMKQEDRTTRRATAELVDCWSFGVTLIPSDMRIATELAYFLKAVRYPGRLYPLDDLVWSKLSYVLGFFHPHDTPFDAATEIAIQKAFFDHMWDRPLVEIVDRLGGTEGASPDPGLTELAQSLNEGVAAYACTIKGFASAFEEEVHGIVDLMGNTALEILIDMAGHEAIAPPCDEDRGQHIDRLKNLLVAALKIPAERLILRTSYILAALHAAVRANKGRKFKPNDLHDFDHAAAAIAYCDAFFTERSLCSLVTTRPADLAAVFDCHVTASAEGALKWLVSQFG